MGRRLKRKTHGRQGVERQHQKASEIFKDNEKQPARAEEIETLLLEKLERWEMLEEKQNGG